MSKLLDELRQHSGFPGIFKDVLQDFEGRIGGIEKALAAAAGASGLSAEVEAEVKEFVQFGQQKVAELVAASDDFNTRIQAIEKELAALKGASIAPPSQQT